MLPHLISLAQQKGWHFKGGVGIQVAFNAKSFRTPEPRFSATELPHRSSFERFNLSADEVVWKRLESSTKYSAEANQHALIGTVVPILISIFHSATDLSTIQDEKKILPMLKH
jgi:hypothetical protein